jgi:hypothetical protein
MVRIDGHLVVGHPDDRDDLLAALVLGLELHAGLDVVDPAERGAGDGLDHVRVLVPVRLVGRDLDLERVAGALALQGVLEPADDVAGAVEVRQRTAALGRVEDLALGVGEGVVDGDDLVFADLHGASFRRAARP